MSKATRLATVSAVLIMVCFGATSSEAACQSPEAEDVPAGLWSGSMTIQDIEFPFSLRLESRSDSLFGTMDAQGQTDLEIEDLEWSEGVLSFRRSGQAGALSFRGEVRADSIVGSVLLGPMEGSFSLTRAPDGLLDSGDAAPRRRALGRSGRISLRSCQPPGMAEEALCGSFRVPENRDGSGARHIDLNLVVLPALDPEAASIPLVVLAGGPGGAATQMAPLFGIQFPDVRRAFDIILIDQRGTGGSNPLQCAHRDLNTQARAVLQVDFDSPDLESCRDGLDADLTQYTTPVAMDDLAEVVRALGHERINVYGLSYGTRAALVLVRRHPELVRTLVLQGVAPLALHLPVSVAADAQASVDGIFRDCAATPACGSAYPDLEAKLRSVLDRLVETPVHIEVRNLAMGDPTTLEITQDIFTGGLRSLLYANAFIQNIPRIVSEADAGNFRPFVEAVTPLIQAFGQTLYFGAYLSVVCAEDVPFIDDETVRVNSENTFLGDRMVRHHRDACERWPQASLPTSYADPVRSDTPTLLISGTSDPVTPPRWGEATAKHLSNSLHIVVPRAGHADSIGPCEQRIVASFLESGNIHALDTRCVAVGRTRRYSAPPN